MATGPGTTDVALIGPGYFASASSIALGKSTRDRLTIAADGHSLRYEAGAQSAAASSAAPRSPALSLAVDAGTSGYELTVSGLTLVDGQAAALRADLVAGILALDNSRGGTSTYRLALARSGSAGRGRFIHQDVSIGAGDTQLLNVGTWDGAGALTAGVDHGSDGTVDETLTLDNEVTKVYLPVITRIR
jgi:hypothetical protein